MLPSFERVRVLESPRIISDVDLIDANDEKFLLSQLRGQIVLIFFGFTNCPDVCPLTMSSWRVLEQSGSVNLKKVEFVLISVDGDRDTPEVMKTYLSRFSENFIGATAEPETVRLLAKQFSAPFFKGNPTAHDEHYDVTHTPQSFILDSSGVLRVEMYGPSTEAMAGIIEALLEESPGSKSESD